MDDKQRISVTIANRPYDLLAEREKLETQEPLSRRAAEVLNVRYGKYQQIMAGSKRSEIQDFLAMAAWDITYDYLSLQTSKDADVLTDEIHRVDTALESYLRSLDEEDEARD